LSTIAKQVPDSPVHCSIDLDAPGKHVGRLELPRSNNTSGWSHLYIPIVSIKNGDGPTALVVGGVHGDEPEGQVAALRLARETAPGEVTGQLIVVPCASPDASRAYTRLWPSGANFNRSFPGSPDGSPDEQLADFFSRLLFPRADVVVDMHSGGRSGLCPPWSEMHWVDDAAQRRAMVDAMLAWGTDYHFVYIDIAGTGLLVGEAERQGKIVVSTELGGGGHVTAEIHRLALSGLQNVLRRFGVIEGEVQTRASLGRPEPVLLMATELDNYLLAPESGLFETVVDLGQRVDVGEPVGRIHFLERPDREPELILSKTAGIVCVVRAIATTEQGDNVVVIAREADRSELD
jgi:predicted deacylase